MTPAERRRRLRKILNGHNDAVGAFRAGSDAFDLAIAGMRQTMDAIQAANHAQREAIDSILTANNAALALFNDEA